MSEVKESDERYTPPWLLDWVEAGWSQIGLDVCTTPDNWTDALGFYALEDGHDGLDQGWDVGLGVVWCNPPYSRGNLDRWVAKAAAESVYNMDILMLTPCDIRTEWFKVARAHAQAVCFIDRAVKFDTPKWGPKQGRPVEVSRGMCLWYFTDLDLDTDGFLSHAADIGWAVRT